jgi:hypothetical protein
MARPPGNPYTARHEIEDELLTRLTVIEDLAHYSPGIEDDLSKAIVEATRKVKSRILHSGSDDEPPTWEITLEARLNNLEGIDEPEINENAANAVVRVLSEHANP